MPNENINSDLIRGNIDAFILKVLSQHDSYGYEIIKTILKLSNDLYELKEPSLYTSLKRLEKAKYITSYWGDESQGARRKYYHITPEGTDYLNHSIGEWHTAQTIITCILIGGNENG